MRLRSPLRLAASCAALLACFALPAFGVEPERQVGIFVPPYYSAGATLVEPPKVAVDPAFDKLLVSRNAADIRKVRDAVLADPAMVKPTTLMVLAIRLYDVGLRDDAVFWFYAARDRYATMEQVLDMRSLSMVAMANAMDGFVERAGPTINGYAFCDVTRQEAQEDKAIEWVAAHPYHLLEAPDVPVSSEDRNGNLARAFADMRTRAAGSKAFLSRPENLAEMKALRASNNADARYCWK